MYNEIIQIIINNKTTIILIITNRFALIINVLIINAIISIPRSSLVRSVKIKDYSLRVNILSTILIH